MTKYHINDIILFNGDIAPSNRKQIKEGIKKSMKKTLSVILILVLTAAVFSGCGGSISGTSISGGSSVATSDENFKFYLLDDGTYAIAANATYEMEVKHNILNMPDDIVIPSEHEGKAVTSIINEGFRGCRNIESVTIPGSVTTISDYAFYDCESLASVTIPDSVKSIGLNAFYNCVNLKNINIPSSVTSIDYEAFEGCSSLQYNEYDNALYLGNSGNPYYAMIKAKNTSVTSININENTKMIADIALSHCKNLTSITIPSGMRSLGYAIFSKCDSLTDVTFTGTRSQWSSIYKEDIWDWYVETGYKTCTVHCSDGDM